MIGLDTNILLRLVLRDDERQWALAQAIVKKLSDADEAARISTISLAELAWALRQTFKRSRQEIAGVVDGLLSTATFHFEDEALVREALRIYRESGADLPDVLIMLDNRRGGCVETLTFDRPAARAGVMTLLDDGRAS